MEVEITAAQDFASRRTGLNCRTVLADPPWQFSNRTGKMAGPMHEGLVSTSEIRRS